MFSKNARNIIIWNWQFLGYVPTDVNSRTPSIVKIDVCCTKIRSAANIQHESRCLNVRKHFSISYNGGINGLNLGIVLDGAAKRHSSGDEVHVLRAPNVRAKRPPRLRSYKSSKDYRIEQGRGNQSLALETVPTRCIRNESCIWSDQGTSGFACPLPRTPTPPPPLPSPGAPKSYRHPSIRSSTSPR